MKRSKMQIVDILKDLYSDIIRIKINEDLQVLRLKFVHIKFEHEQQIEKKTFYFLFYGCSTIHR